MFNIKNILFFVGYILVNPRLCKALLTGVYLPTLIQYEWVKNFNIKTFIDVGAYKGEDSKAIRYLLPQVQIFAFEPDTKNYNYIVNKLKLPNFKIAHLALSNTIGNTLFYSHPLSFLSSQLKTVKQSKERDYFNKKTNKYTVKTLTLDAYFKNIKIKNKIFLKIDTQGTELKVLQGAKSLLRRVDIIHIETSVEKTYQNQAIFDDIYDYLVQNGFKFKGEAMESQFYPQFKLQNSFNSIFIKKT